MTSLPRTFRTLVATMALSALSVQALADPVMSATEQATSDGAPTAGVAGSATATVADKAVAATPPKSKYPPFEDLLGNAESVQGLLQLYKKDGKLFAELTPANFNKDLMVNIALARGIAQTPLLGGMTWRMGDEWLWQFRKVDDRIQIVRRNVRFTAAKGSPQEKAVHLSYTDSILYSLPIVTLSPRGNPVVDLTPVFMSDLPRITAVLQGFAFAPDRSTWEKVKAFKDNVELEIAATYASNGSPSVATVADSRGVTLHVHYSISRLQETGYQPRYADDRVGHFMTVIKDFSKSGENDQFVRYVNRWDLRKAEPSATVSPPLKPIVFWIEKTVPYKYRAAVRQGILDWNKAFEKAGFVNAVEVRQQPDDAAWDPEDINYNTFRWITANAGFAQGPSRVNPLTGQILDADIIFDADFVEHWGRIIPMQKPEIVRDSAVSSLNLDRYLTTPHRLPGAAHEHDGACECARMASEQMTFGAMAIATPGKPLPKEKVEKLVMEGVRNIACHEVGHTLGLRHNFKASTLMTMEELNDPEKTRDIGIASSVMDYVPVNVVPDGKKQGDYFSQSVGPYDCWAIEYAYKPFPGGTEGELPELRKIAARCTEPSLQFATDGDADGFNPDPLVNRYDLSKNPIEWARWRVELIQQLLPDLVDQVTEPGNSYERARKGFSVLLSEHRRAMIAVARFIGGVYVHRDHKGDPNARPPFVVVEAAKQREAIAFLEEQVLGPQAYQFPESLYNYLAPPRWDHWGVGDGKRLDYPVHETILAGQDQVLAHVLAPVTLARLLDGELKVPADKDAFTTVELLQKLTSAVFRETEKLQEGQFTNRAPAISSLRRNLQQRYFERLANLAMGNAGAPSDCQTLAAAELQGLENRLKQVLAGKAALDTYSRSHLSELASRIRKVLDARLELPQP